MGDEHGEMQIVVTLLPTVSLPNPTMASISTA